MTAGAILTFVALAFAPCQPSTAASLNPLDYFSYTYTITFNQTYVNEGEVFYADLEGVATCTKDAPVHPTEAYIKGRVVGRHLEDQTRVALNSAYSTTISPVPSREGEVITASQEIALYFPPGSPAGEYEVTAELIEARFKTGGLWFDATSALPQEKTMGNAFYKVAKPEPAEPTTTTTPPVTTTAPPVGPTEPTTGPTTKPTITTPSEPTQTDPAEPIKPTTSAIPTTKPTTEPDPGEPSVPPGATDITGLIDTNGAVSAGVFASSADGLASIQVEPGTTLTMSDGKIPAWLMLSRSVSTVQTSDGKMATGSAYELLPEGISFNSHAMVYISYYDGQIPAGMDENLLLIARWDEIANTWIALGNSEVNGEHNTISAPIYQSGVYTILAPVSGPAFVIDDLSISPTSAAAGEMVSIQCQATNQGSTAGYYEITLKLNGNIQEVRKISLAGGASRVISFGIIRNSPGVYNVEVNGLRASYQVTGSQSPTTHSTTLPPPSPSEETVFYWVWILYAFNGILLIVLILLARHWLVKKH